jgi:hypothetical protein
MDNIYKYIKNNNDLCKKIYNKIFENSYEYKNNLRYIKLLYNDDYHYYIFSKTQLYEFIGYIISPYTLTKKYINVYDKTYKNKNVSIKETTILKDSYNKLINKKYQEKIYKSKIENMLNDPITYINTDYNIFYIMSNIFIKINSINDN